MFCALLYPPSIENRAHDKCLLNIFWRRKGLILVFLINQFLWLHRSQLQHEQTSSLTRDQIWVPSIGSRVFNHWTIREALTIECEVKKQQYVVRRVGEDGNLLSLSGFSALQTVSIFHCSSSSPDSRNSHGFHARRAGWVGLCQAPL